MMGFSSHLASLFRTGVSAEATGMAREAIGRWVGLPPEDRTAGEWSHTLFCRLTPGQQQSIL
ncbi:hypothetical protein MSA03_23520 [Microbacterium saccharophilum]|nr:hypothetical protein MSA03_23520 [Microbacterium saccharophilum]